MAGFPRGLTEPTPENLAFLRRSLAAVGHPRSVVPERRRAACRQIVRAALAGLVTPLAAAAALTKAHEEAQLAELRAEPGGVRRIERFPLKDAPGRMGDPLGLLERFVDEHAQLSLEITELELDAEVHPTMTMNAYLAASSETRAVHDAYIHPPGSRVWRYLPLQLLVSTVLDVASATPIELQLTATNVALADVRDLLARQRPARPLCVASVPFDERGFAVHGGVLDAYQMTLHDLTHVVVLGTRPRARPSEAVLLYDALEAAIHVHVREEERSPALHELLDHVVSGYDGLREGVAHVERRLGELSVMGVPRSAEIAATFRDRVARTTPS